MAHRQVPGSLIAPDLPSYAEALHDAFLAAAGAAGGPVDRHLDLGGVRVRVRLASPSLVPLVRALAHRAVPAGDASLTVCVGAGPTPGSLPEVASSGEWWSRRRPGAGGGDDDGDHAVRALHVGPTGALSVLDGRRRRAIFWVPGPRGIAAEASAPLLHVLTWALARDGRYPVHAGAVGTPDGGVLLAGKGGAGKSTSALACLDSALLHAGDDYVLLSSAATPLVHSLYQSAKLHADQLWRLPAVTRGLDARDAGKAVLFLDDRYPHKLAAGFAVRAVVLPRVTGRRDTTLVPATPAEALDALVPSSVVELPGLGREGVRAIVDVVRRVPSYVLEAGTDLTRIPVAIAGLLERLRRT